ncbi:DUF3263 domain-containing protein [Microbacterium sp. 1.5R]|uniref:DUF3263 domain-containing protein n=1 Tax=Microbacterium sp. 1.5R TaxID=1916917 RepID=UPI0037CBB0D5
MNTARVSVVRERVGTVTHAEILAFEAAHPSPSPHRDERIRRDLGISPVRYAVLLRRAANSGDGIAAHPLTARRVRERADRRARARLARVSAAAARAGAAADHRVQDTVQTPEGPTRLSA